MFDALRVKIRDADSRSVKNEALMMCPLNLLGLRMT